MSAAGAQPLSGIRVLDFSSMMAGPYCSRWLADLGADVIKVEPPEGDYMRTTAPMRKGHSAYFAHLNCGKRSIVLNLKRASAVEIARQLAARCDVLLEGSRPGVMARLKLDYHALKSDCPSLVYCSVSGYGQEGPRSQSPGYAAIVHATSGFDSAWQSAQGEQAQPPTCGIQIADVVAASFAAMAIQSALLARYRTSRGQHIDLSLAEGMMALMPLDLVRAQFPGDSRRAMYRPVRAADGFVVVTPITQGNFVDLCLAIGREELRNDIRFATPIARSENWDALLSEVGAWAERRDSASCVAELARRGVPAANYRTVAEALADPQLHTRGFLGRARDAAGEIAVANLPFRLNSAPVRTGVAAVPGLGEHSRQVLADLLGLGGAELSEALERTGRVSA
jgi:crotonobetainyl-CoA:carnitine CoA-transferase CaiB-like acyl-CoA transferase